MGMRINLTPHIEGRVRQKVNSGLYLSAGAVMCVALRLMDEQDNFRAAKLERLRQDIRAGIKQWPDARRVMQARQQS